MKKPNFFIIGAPKCGTTSLAAWLGQHPQVYFSPVKEPHFFNDKDELQEIRSLDAYEALFAGVNEQHLAIGEGSIWYLSAPEAVPNIEAYTQRNAKYIVCLRNPVDMAYSLHSEMLVNGNEPVADFEKAWRLQADRASGKIALPFSIAPTHLQYHQSCALGSMLKRLYETVPTERVLVLYLDDTSRDPKATLRKIAEFLGIDDDFDKIDISSQNSAKRPASLAVIRFVALVGAFKHALRIRIGFGIVNRLRRLNTIQEKRPSLQPEFRAELVKAFAPEVALLENLTEENLDHWRK